MHYFINLFRKFVDNSVHADMTVLVIKVKTKTIKWSWCELGVIAADLTCLPSVNSFSNSKPRVNTTANHYKG